MRVWFVAFAFVCEIPLMVIHRLIPDITDYLPLGGDDFTQLAILTLMAAFVEEMRKLIGESVKAITDMIRRWKEERPLN
jgi:hypothetical protein